MTSEQKIYLKQNTILAFTVGTFLTVIGAVFWFGREIERASAKINNAVSVHEMTSWEYKAERLNPGWTAPAIIDIRARHNPMD